VCIPQILRVIPYSATQLYSYEVLKRAFSDRDGKLSVPARLSAGACAGMTATLVRCALAGESRSFSRPALHTTLPRHDTLLPRNTMLQTPCVYWGCMSCAQEYRRTLPESLCIAVRAQPRG